MARVIVNAMKLMFVRNPSRHEPFNVACWIARKIVADFDGYWSA